MTYFEDHVEIITDGRRRRRWPASEKLRIVEESFEPGETVSSVALPYDELLVAFGLGWVCGYWRASTYIKRAMITNPNRRDIAMIIQKAMISQNASSQNPKMSAAHAI